MPSLYATPQNDMGTSTGILLAISMWTHYCKCLRKFMISTNVFDDVIRKVPLCGVMCLYLAVKISTPKRGYHLADDTLACICLIKMCAFWLEMSLLFVPEGWIVNKPILGMYWLRVEQEARPCLTQCWPRSITPYGTICHNSLFSRSFFLWWWASRTTYIGSYSQNNQLSVV